MFDTTENDLRYIRRFLHDHLLGKELIAFEKLEILGFRLLDEPIPFDEAMRRVFTPMEEGESWGPPWSTLWLKVKGDVPKGWLDRPNCEVLLEVDLDFTDQPGFQAEALIYDKSGAPIKAVNPLNRYLRLDRENVDLCLELAANPNVGDFTYFTPTLLGRKETAPPEELYTLKRLRMSLRSLPVLELQRDIRTLVSLAEATQIGGSRRIEVVEAVMRAIHKLDLADIERSSVDARSELAHVLSVPASSGSLTMFATGHAHIDSAWLWPIRETVRKCARTFANVCYLLDRYPDWTFSCSSAQQYQWVKDAYPKLYERIKTHVRSGRFVPVGGMWVECDANLTSGEAWARQFLYGKKFFIEEFGVETKETWLPDTFGYPAALPQISKLAGNEYFLTQKVSWNEYNTFPHHTFWWEGIDGSRQYTHFPPADTYNSTLEAQELVYFEKNFKEKGRVDAGLGLFGWGDGGGGPTEDHLANLERHANLGGLPRTKSSTSKEFFEYSLENYPNAPVWVGELYLELHRGAQSSQLGTKQGNRRAEAWLRDAELWCTYAQVHGAAEYPYAKLEELWKVLLLHQFHDILPGSSIGWVHDEAEKVLADVSEAAKKLGDSAVEYLQRKIMPGGGKLGSDSSPILTPSSVDAVSTGEADGHYVLANSHVETSIDRNGNIVSLKVPGGRELFVDTHPAARLRLYRDTPPQWDAWDVDRNYRRVWENLDAPEAVERGYEEDGDAWISFVYRRGLTTVKKTFTLASGQRAVGIELDIDWHEKQQMLKLEFPLKIRSSNLRSEIQFGYVDRSILPNTMWDFARFETCAHRWVRLEEGGFGVAIANDSTYGFDTEREVLAEGQTLTTVSATVIRGPLFPDPTAEEGTYRLRYSILPNASTLEAYGEGYRLNLPRRVGERTITSQELVRFDDPAILVEAIKLAEDRSGDVIVRCFESQGEARKVAASFGFPVARVEETDLLERPNSENGISAQELSFRPFEIKTLRLKRLVS